MKYLELFEKYNPTGKVLNVSGQNLYEISLQYLPIKESVVVFYCYNNYLRALPTLPSKLERLFCYKNQLEQLPELPTTLRFLSCYSNNLQDLSKLPKSLEYLECDHTLMKFIPISTWSEMLYVNLKKHTKNYIATDNDIIEYVDFRINKDISDYKYIPVFWQRKFKFEDKYPELEKMKEFDLL